MTDRVIDRVALDDLHLESQKFDNKDDIKPWLQDALLRNKGINIVIERSDNGKIIFRCKNNVNEKRIVKSKRKDNTTLIRKHTTCPFKIRANYSVKNKAWGLLVVSDEHDHPIERPQIVEKQSNAAIGPSLNNSPSVPLSSTPSVNVAESDSTNSPSVFMNSNDNSKSRIKSPANRRSNSRSSKSSLSSSARNSHRNSRVSSSSTSSSGSTSIDDLKNMTNKQPNLQPPAPLVTSNSFHGTDIRPPSQPVTSTKRRKSVPSSLPKVKKLKDNFVSISPIQEDPNGNTGFVVPGIELQQLQSLHPVLPQPRSRQEHEQQQSPQQQPPPPVPAPPQQQSQQLQSRQPLQLAKQPRQPKQPKEPRQPQRQRNAQQVPPSPQQQQQLKHVQSQLDGIQVEQESKKSDQFQIVHVLQNLQNFVREKVKHEILDNKNIHENVKTDLLDSFVSQIILDYRNILSSQFLFSLRQNLYDKRSLSDPLVELGSGENDQVPQAPQFTPLKKSNISQNWLPTATPGVGGLIRLSPLLNDSDTTEYVVGSNPNNQNNATGQTNSLDNLTHLPGITSNTLNYLMQLPPPSNNALMLANTSIGNSMNNQQFSQNQPPPLMPPLQTPGQQLPPLNTIQKLPQGNTPNTNQSTLPPPLNNVGSTLNPSSLLKTSKNNSNSSNHINNSNTNGNGNNANNNGSNNVFNSYFMNPSVTNPAFLFNNNSSTNPSNSNIPKEGNPNVHSTMLNNMTNYDSGW